MAKVWLVGAGPGSADLLTVRAARLLESADIVFHDALVQPETLALARRARLVDVGKRFGRHSTEQRFINRAIVEAARTHETVVRLKGGDPMIFGRAVEEMTALAAAGVPFEIVPGITAAIGCAAAIGLPLTEREARRGLAILTGHASDGVAEHDWQALACPGQTVAVYMGVGAAPHIEARLLAAGIDPRTPVTVVENGTLPQQKLALGTAGRLVETLIDGGIKGPAVIFIGAHPFSRHAAPAMPPCRPARPQPARAEIA